MTKNKILSFYFSLLFLGCMCFFLKTATVEFANKSSVISLKSISYLRTNDGVTGWDEFSVLKDDAGIVILSADTTLTYDAALTDLVINNSNAILSLENTTVIINNNLNKSLYGYEIDTSGIDFWRIAAGTSKPTTGRSVWGVGSIGLGLNLYAHKLTTTFEWVQITNSPGAFDATQVDVSVSKIDRNYVAIVVNENRAYYCTNASGNTSGINTTPTWIGPMENLGTPFTSCRRVAIGSNANNLYIIDSSRVYKRNTDTSFTDLGPVADDISVDINDKLWSVMSNSSNLNRYTGSGASWEVMGSVPNGKDLTNVSAYDENRVLVTDEDG